MKREPEETHSALITERYVPMVDQKNVRWRTALIFLRSQLK